MGLAQRAVCQGLWVFAVLYPLVQFVFRSLRLCPTELFHVVAVVEVNLCKSL